VTTTSLRSAERRVATAPSVAKRWSWVQWLALAGAPILLLEVWTLVAWLADGPYQVTQYRDKDSASWVAAHVFEVVALVLAAVVFTHVIRECLRQRRMTFDAHFLLVGMTIFWADTSPNFFGPTHLYSSNFVNLNNALGYMPGIINPDIGRIPDPLLFTIPLESAGFLAVAMALGWLTRKIRERRPGISTAQLVLILFGVSCVVDLIVELPIIALGLWSYMSPSWMSISVGQGLKYAHIEIIVGAFTFLLPSLIRIFKDDHGRTICERGLDRYSSRLRRHGLTWLALYGAMQLIVWIPGTMPLWAYGPYETPWPKVPRHLVNGVCDAPGFTDTRYGPCPGSPGYRMPGRGSFDAGP
jgi:hypothetical protein